jgi:thymidylate synthase (FAD)
MYAEVVAITQPFISGISAEDFVLYCARVSSPKNQQKMENGEMKDDKLLSYLIKHKHWSPFEMVDVTFKIETNMAVAAQLLRHNSFRFQQFSQRYAKVNVEDALEPIELRRANKNNRQSSEEVFNPLLADEISAQFVIKDMQWKQLDLYEELIAAGVAPETARFVLPLNTKTTMFAKGNLRSWITYLNVRLEEHAQKEHRDLAVTIAMELSKHFPLTADALSYFNNYKGGFI